MTQRYPGDPTATDPAGPPAATAETSPAPPGPPPPMAGPTAAQPARPRKGLIILLSALVAAVVGAGIGVASYAAFDHSSNTSSITVTNQAGPTASPGTGTVAAAAAGIGPSVVTINVVGQTSAGTGSGVIIRSDGYILTNNHVVTLDGTAPASSDRITVTLANGSEQTASVTGTDPADDLAVVKVSGQPAQSAAVFARSSALQVGQEVVAVGAPLGLSNTVTSGIVSALNRPVQAGNSGESIFNAIQTDAAINPGNSGGPLVDLNGHVVGINSAIATASTNSQGSGNIGIGFAIPSDEATRIAGQLIDTGHASHAVIGVTVSSASAAQGGGPTSAQGATVTGVTSDGPAAKAGIKTGDVITAVGPQRIDDSTGLIAAVRSYPPGQTVPVTISRNGATSTVSVTLGESTG